MCWFNQKKLRSVFMTALGSEKHSPFMLSLLYFCESVSFSECSTWCWREKNDLRVLARFEEELLSTSLASSSSSFLSQLQWFSLPKRINIKVGRWSHFGIQYLYGYSSVIFIWNVSLRSHVARRASSGFFLRIIIYYAV